MSSIEERVTKIVVEQLGVSEDGKVYFGEALGVAQDFRGRGLGRELVLRSHQHILKFDGAEYSYLIASGIYSQAVFSKVGFQALAELEYKTFVDKYGQQIIWDNQEHEMAKLMFMKF